MLRVNQEAREQALTFYKPAFATTTHPAQVYVDFSLDTVVFRDRSSSWPTVNSNFRNTENGTGAGYLRYLDITERSKIQSLAIDYQENFLDDFYFTPPDVGRLKAAFPNVTSMLLWNKATLNNTTVPASYDGEFCITDLNKGEGRDLWYRYDETGDGQWSYNHHFSADAPLYWPLRIAVVVEASNYNVIPQHHALRRMLTEPPHSVNACKLKRLLTTVACFAK